MHLATVQKTGAANNKIQLCPLVKLACALPPPHSLSLFQIGPHIVQADLKPTM